MKKLAILILTIVMATSLVGCDKFTKKEEKEKSLHYFWSAISFSNTAILTTCVIVML